MNAFSAAPVALLLSALSVIVSGLALAHARQARDNAGPASFRKATAEARELIGEMADTMEKLSIWSARLAKRNKKDAQEALGDVADPGTVVEPSPSAPPLESVQSRAAWKAAARAQLGRR